MNLTLSLCLSLLLIIVNCEWRLHWNDEFDSSMQRFFDRWQVKHENETCDGIPLSSLHCKRNSTRNLWLVNGSLAIAAVRENYLNKNFTSATINTRQAFTYGKFEIRAALPRGKFLRPVMYLTPEVYGKFWPENGEMDIMANLQRSVIFSSIHYNFGETPNAQSHSTIFDTNAYLDQFHTYSFIWNETTIIWLFDEKPYFNGNLTELLEGNANPFTKPFKLGISLGVGGRFFSGPNSTKLSEEDVMAWNYSLFVLDYVRVYKWDDITQQDTNLNSTFDNTDRSEICQYIMPLIRFSESDHGQTSSIAITVISVATITIVLLIVTCCNVVVYYKKANKSGKLGMYDDTGNRQKQYYENAEDNYYSNYNTCNKLSAIDMQNDYLEITNKYA